MFFGAVIGSMAVYVYMYKHVYTTAPANRKTILSAVIINFIHYYCNELDVTGNTK